jgi:DNA invertase Pin-like site-specific DNA recombinase
VPASMAPKSAPRSSEHDDERRAATASNLVEILIGTAAPRLANPLPRWEDIVTVSARAGTGGRRKRLDRGFEIEATRELRERYGDPEEVPYRGSLLLIWTMDPDGDGILAARLSSMDVQKGETALSQIHNGLALAAGHILKPAYALVAMRMSGGAKYEHRRDLEFIRHRVADQGVRWVCYREPDRIARDQHAAFSLYKFLEETGTHLYLCSLGRKVDWDSAGDRLLISTQGMIGEFGRAQIKANTHRAIRDRWLETQRGYPGLKPIGFRRNADGYLEQDPEQWPYVVQMHEMYSRLMPDGGTSVRELAAFLTDTLGFTVSRDRVRKMLKDPIYVTGMKHVNYEGAVYPLKEIKLVDPVPVATFELNQALMSAVKGRRRKNPLGHYLLNRIDFRHDICQHETIGEKERPILLRAEGKAYRHTHVTPHLACSGLVFPRQEIDAAIINELLRLCEDPDLQREYQKRAITDDAEKTPAGILSRAQVRSTQARIADLNRQREEKVRRWLDEGAASHDIDPRYLQEAAKHIDGEITRLERQIDISKRLHAAQKSPPRDDRAQLLERARQILTTEPPEDPDLRQRRRIFVQQALSKVIARRTKNGFELELRGPMIPPDSAPLQFDILQHARAVLDGGTDFEGNSWKSVPMWTHTCGAVWQSEPIQIPWRWVRRVGSLPPTRERMRDAILEVSADAAPGPIRARLHDGLDRRKDLVSFDRFLGGLLELGVSLDEETVAVLGRQRALVLQRVKPASISDWRMLIGCAMDEGMSFERGWSRRWDGLNARVHWLGPRTRMTAARRTLGFSLNDLVAHERERRGLPAIELGHRPEADRAVSLDACLDALREATRLAPPGLLSWTTVTATLNGRPDLPSTGQIMFVLASHGLTKWMAMREALGAQEAVASGRVTPRTQDEWVTVMVAAIDDGLSPPGRGWRVRWSELRARHARYVTCQAVERGARRLGGMNALYSVALAQVAARDAHEQSGEG